MAQVEGDYMREKKLHEVDEMLLFAMDEKGHSIHLSDRGLDELSPGDPAILDSWGWLLYRRGRLAGPPGGRRPRSPPNG